MNMLTENPVGNLGDADMNAISCPRCGSTDVRASQRTAIRLFHTTYRCRSCKRHFRIKTASQKILQSVLLGLGAAVLLAFVLVWILGSGSSPVPEQQTVVEPDIAHDLALANKGDPNAQFRIGLYYWGREDYRQAFPWLKKAEVSNEDAKYYMGLAYLEGRGTVQNYRLAFDRFQETAKQGNLEAEYRLGLMYRDGMGVASSKERAYTWLNIAAARGHVLAGESRDRMANIMSNDEINRAQEASTEELNRLQALSTPGVENVAKP